MGKIVLSSNVTLDGVVQDPDGEEGFARGGWFHQFVGSKDLEDWVDRETQEALAAEVLLMGRRSSEWFASRMLAVEGADVRVSPEWAQRVKTMPKYVVSSSLDDPQWANATVLSGDAAKEIRELKDTVAGEILVYGSYNLTRTLLAEDLVDELRLVVFPVLLGAGRRIFDESVAKKPLQLVDARRLGDGLVCHTYRLAGS
jgi:dihydrofolate reductase